MFGLAVATLLAGDVAGGGSTPPTGTTSTTPATYPPYPAVLHYDEQVHP